MWEIILDSESIRNRDHNQDQEEVMIKPRGGRCCDTFTKMKSEIT